MLYVSHAMHGQISITEISYNPPEMGNDSLEYIELFNHSESDVDLTGYKFSAGVNHTFAEGTLAKGAYLLLAGNTQAIKNVFGVDATKWTDGALLNGGEEITLLDGAGNTVTSVTFKDVAPWPTRAEGTDGDGRSIEICNPKADPNDGANWKVSENKIDVTIEGYEVYGTPGKANSISDCGTTPDATVIVSSNVFTPADITINVGETVEWTNTGGNHNVNGSLATFPSNPEGFYSGAASSDAWSFSFTFNLPGIYQYQCDPHASLGMIGRITVIMPVVTDPFPKYEITTASTVNGAGVADSLGVNCTLEGIVYGGNLRATGLQFYIVDENNNGIGVFDNSFDFGYTVTEGDKIQVKGAIAQYNGLTQIDVSELTVLSSGNDLVNPKIIDTYLENDESSLVSIQNVSFKDPSQWIGTGSGFNVTMTNGNTDFVVRIDNDVDLYTMSIPDGALFNVKGMLSQFDSSEPYDSGYQLIPRYALDFEKVSSSEDVNIHDIKIYPNPAQDVLHLNLEEQINEVSAINIDGKSFDLTFDGGIVNVSNLIDGTYILKLQTENKTLHIPFIIKH